MSAACAASEMTKIALASLLSSNISRSRAKARSAERGEAMSRVGPERVFVVSNRDVCRLTLRFTGSVSVFRALGDVARGRETPMSSSSSNPFDSQA